MGIHGLWEELSPAADKIGGIRPSHHLTDLSALTKLAVDHYEKTGKPLRLAIDASVWSFQIQNGQAGSHPALRTFYYRLCRLLQANVLPVFVFNGPDKPPFKRNQRTSGYIREHWETRQMKLLIKAFGFMSWDAPGEAE